MNHTAFFDALKAGQIAPCCRRGVTILRTNTCGDITITVRNGALVVSPYLTGEVP